MLAFFRKKDKNFHCVCQAFPLPFHCLSLHLDVLPLLFLPVLNIWSARTGIEVNPDMDGPHGQKQALTTRLWPSDVLSCTPQTHFQWGQSCSWGEVQEQHELGGSSDAGMHFSQHSAKVAPNSLWQQHHPACRYCHKQVQNQVLTISSPDSFQTSLRQFISHFVCTSLDALDTSVPAFHSHAPSLVQRNPVFQAAHRESS